MSDKELLDALDYLFNWPHETELSPGRSIDWPEYDYGDKGWNMHARTHGIHRNDSGKCWTIGSRKTWQECIIDMAKLLPTVNTDSDYQC